MQKKKKKKKKKKRIQNHSLSVMKQWFCNIKLVLEVFISNIVIYYT